MSKGILEHILCFLTVGEKVDRIDEKVDSLQKNSDGQQRAVSEHFKEVVHNDTCAKCEGIRNAQHKDVTGQLSDIKQILLNGNGASSRG